jgi:long-chain acyl-CoA synthetase
VEDLAQPARALITGLQPSTVFAVLEATAAAHPELPALREKRDGAWRAFTWEEYRRQALAVARGFLALGLEPGQGVAILGANSPRWFFADLGAIAAGGVPTGIYTTSTPEQCRYVLENCAAGVAVVEHAGYLANVDRAALPGLRAVVLMEGEGEGDGVLSWRALVAAGEGVPEADVRARLARQRPDDLATLIYTSGTTGAPKGVMLSHRNLTWVAERVATAFRYRPGDSVVSYLPLSHIAEQIISLHAPIATGGCTWFAESLDKLVDNLREVRPQVFFGVPRVWEKFQAALQAAGAKSPPLKRRITAWARRQGLAGGYADQRGGRRPRLYSLAERMVFATVRRRLGLDRAAVCSTSAAPINLDTLEFFLSLGIPVLEVYGMSECTGPATFSVPDRYRTGKAGFVIPGTEIKLAADGEICMRGPHVFLGYYKSAAATREAIDDEGWLHSGDIGTLDEEGFLKVTDRKKELIITSGGKNVAPQPLEAKLKAIPAVGQAVALGDRRNYVTALLTLDPDLVAGAAAAAGSPARDPASAAACPRFRADLERRVAAVNGTLARYEQVRRFAVLPGQFTVEGGELTPTMKLKRRVIGEKYTAEIEALYSAGAAGAESGEPAA